MFKENIMANLFTLSSRIQNILFIQILDIFDLFVHVYGFI